MPEDPKSNIETLKLWPFPPPPPYTCEFQVNHPFFVRISPIVLTKFVYPSSMPNLAGRGYFLMFFHSKNLKIFNF